MRIIDKEKVSIIMPVYNVERFVEEALLSLLRQTYSNIEIVIINDCTRDESMKIIKEVLSTENYTCSVKIVEHENNQGLSVARNTGISHASGQYVYFFDSDDYLPDYSIEELMVYTNFDPDFIIGEIDCLGGKRTKFTPLLLKNGLVLTGRAVLESYLRGEWYEMAVNKVIKKEFLISNNLFFQKGLLHEDVLWSFNLAFSAHKMAVSSRATYIYRLHSSSITSNISLRNINSLCEITKDINNKLCKLNSPLTFNYIENSKFQVFYLTQTNDFSKEESFEVLKKLKEINKIDRNLFSNKALGLNVKIKSLAYNMPIRYGFYYLKLLVLLTRLKRQFHE